MDENASDELRSHDFTSFNPFTPKNEQYFSPDADTRTPPPRILSNQSLAGEDIVSSFQQHSSEHVDVELSPFTPSEATTPPDLQIPTSLSPPRLNQNPEVSHLEFQQSGQSAASPFRASGNSRTRPPRVPQISLHSSRNADNRHGRVSSNTDYSFLSALTESPPDFSVPRRRTVSWDMNDSTARRETNDRRGSPGATTNFSHKSTPANLLQPVLVDDPNPTTPPRSIFTGKISMDPPSKRPGPQIPKQSIGKNEQDVLPRPADTGSVGKPDALKDSSPPRPFGQPKKNIFRGPPKASSSTSETMPMALDANVHPLDFISGASDTGSFVRTSEPTTETRTFRKPGQTTNYKLNEVLNAAPREGADEAKVLQKIESKSSQSGHPLLLPMVDDNLAQNTDDDDQVHSSTTEKTKNYAEMIASQASETLDSLARRLAEVSPPHQPDRTNSSQDQDKHYRTPTQLFTGEAPDFLDLSQHKDIENGMASSPHGSTSLPRKKMICGRLLTFWKGLRNDFHTFVDFVEPKKEGLRATFLPMIRLLVLPSLALASLLFWAGNPPTGKYTDDSDGKVIETSKQASASWWLLFLGVRQVVTLGLGICMELVVIQFWTFRTRSFPKLLGPTLSLLFAHSRGWPFQLFAWALFDLLLLVGDRPFASHWLHWQNLLGLFNETNPAGKVVSSVIYTRLIYSACVLSFAVAAKRAILGINGGKRLVLRYREGLAKLMHKLIVVSEVANLANSLEHFPIPKLSIDEIVENDDEKANDSFEYSEAATMAASDSPGREYNASGRTEMSYLLEEWDEPELREGDTEEPTIASILQFRKTLGVISDEYPFSTAFGNARTRDRCVQSSQNLYEKLATTSQTGNSHIEFDTLCKIASTADGDLDREKVKELIRIFRPNRTGQISKIEFVKSIDSVYKMLRMLLASINNASQIDRASETLFSTCFYIIWFFIILGVFGFDISSLFIFLSGLLVSFAFMIGSASSKYIEGLLFILVRKPYDIGDRIEIATVNDNSNSDGPTASAIVEKVDLFATTVRVATTREIATFSNGSLACMKITNLRRSERANVYMNLKFGVEVTSDQIDEFRQRVLLYTRDRPREWISVVAFRCTRIEVDLGFVEYLVALQHRDSWQSLPGILQSKGDFLSFALQTQKVLGIDYSAPRLPIDVLPSKEYPSMPFPIGRQSQDFESLGFEPKKDR